MDLRTLARWRLHTLRLAGDPYDAPPDVVGGLLAVQAENRAQAGWAVAARTRGVTEDAVVGLLDDGVLLRTHVLRPTWHFVLPDDIRWLVELTAPRVRRTWQAQQSSLGTSDADLHRSRSVLVDALAREGTLTRDELGERLRGAGLAADGKRLGLLLADAEQQALLCSGPGDGYALLAHRAPHARRLDRDEALAEIALRYFRGHGPATERDLSYWAMLSLTEVRSGIAAVADRLQRIDVDGTTYWSAAGPPDGVDRLEPRAHLLQTLDEYHNGYQHSRYLLDLAGIVPRRRLPSVGMALVDGQMVGGMRRDVREGSVLFSLTLYRGLDATERRAVGDAADRCGAFLGRRADVVLTAA